MLFAKVQISGALAVHEIPVRTNGEDGDHAEHQQPLLALTFGKTGHRYLTERETGTVLIDDGSGVWYAAESANSVTSLPSTRMIDERSSWTFSMNGDASSTFMNRVSAWMSTVLPTRRNCTRGTLELSTAGGPALPFLPAGGGADDCCAVLIVLVCTIEVTHVYGGR